MRKGCAAIFAALAIFGGTTAGRAQDVTLSARNGELELGGTLLGFDGEFFRLDTVYGELTVDGSGVTCAGSGCPDPETFVPELRLSGSAVMGRVMMPALLAAFALREGYDSELLDAEAAGFTHLLRDPDTGKPVARLAFGATTADEGFADLLANQTDIVLSTREIRPEERKRVREAGMGDLSALNRSRVLALDAIVPVVSPANGLRRISAQDLASAVSGEISNWSEIGGPDAPIVVHLPDARTGLGQSVENRLQAPAGLGVSPGAFRHADSAEVAREVAKDRFALGIASFSESGDARALALSGDCGFVVAANRRNIKTEDYPLTAPMFVYLPARRLPAFGREFLAWLRSPGAQLVIRRAGFVDQTPEEIDIDAQGRRLANAILSAGVEIRLEELQRMVATLVRMRRLTTSFRFEAGSIRLDAQSRSNVVQLSRALAQGKYDARTLLFVGFSDGAGGAEANRDIALRRAEAVRRAVVSAADTADLQRVTLDVNAFGEALPLACDDSPWGRQANRRVEVWVR